MKGIQDSLRREDINPPKAKAPRVKRARIMFAVVLDGRDMGAHRTRAQAEDAAAALGPAAYVTECRRVPLK